MPLACSLTRKRRTCLIESKPSRYSPKDKAVIMPTHLVRHQSTLKHMYPCFDSRRPHTLQTKLTAPTRKEALSCCWRSHSSASFAMAGPTVRPGDSTCRTTSLCLVASDQIHAGVSLFDAGLKIAIASLSRYCSLVVAVDIWSKAHKRQVPVTPVRPSSHHLSTLIPTISRKTAISTAILLHRLESIPLCSNHPLQHIFCYSTVTAKLPESGSAQVLRHGISSSAAGHMAPSSRHLLGDASWQGRCLWSWKHPIYSAGMRNIARASITNH